MEKEFELLRQTTDIQVLIKLLPTLSFIVQKFFYQNSPLAKRIVNRILSGLDETIFLGDIPKESFFISFLESTSLEEFRSNVNQIAKLHASYEFFSNVKKYLENLMDSFDVESGLFETQKNILKKPEESLKSNTLFYNVIDNDKYNFMRRENINLKEYFQKRATCLLSDLIINALFEDNYYNVLLNIKEIMRFQKKKRYLRKEKNLFYQKTLKIDEMSNEEKLSFYREYRNLDISSLFYEDIRYLKNISYQKMKEKLFSIQDYQKQHKPIWWFGIQVYDLRNEEYVILERTLMEPFKKRLKDIRRCCYNLINEKKNAPFCNNEFGGVVYGYSTFSIENVLHVYEQDAFSCLNELIEQKTGTFAVNRIIKVEELIFQKYLYNEIQIINPKKNNSYEMMNPSFIISYNKIAFRDIVESFRLHIPIVLLKRAYHQFDFEYSFDKSCYLFGQGYVVLKKRLENICKRDKS